MGWNGFVVVLSVFLLISDAPSLSFDLNGRKLVASQPANNSAATQVESSLYVHRICIFVVFEVMSFGLIWVG